MDSNDFTELNFFCIAQKINTDKFLLGFILNLISKWLDSNKNDYVETFYKYLLDESKKNYEKWEIDTRKEMRKGVYD